VAVDLRNNSATYKQWVSIELTEENKKQFFIPQGFAHGFLTLTDNVKFEYKVDNYYDKQSDRSIIFNDRDIGIDWNCDNPILSEKDKNAPILKDCDVNF
jgi:dTDP-4-dehydrorhamnose 3,5-epimerase